MKCIGNSNPIFDRKNKNRDVIYIQTLVSLFIGGSSGELVMIEVKIIEAMYMIA